MALYTLAPQPWLIFLDDLGRIVPGGQLAIYAAGTSTPAVTYTSATGIAHPFPITLDSAGRVPGGLYLQPGLSYKFVLHEKQIEEPLDGGIIKSQEPIEAVPPSTPMGAVLTLSVPGDYVNINVSGVGVLQYVGGNDITIRGLVGGVLGQSLLIRNLGPATVWLYSQDPAAPAGAGLLSFVAIGPMPLVGDRGSAHFTYLSSGVWGMDSHMQGLPATQLFNAANYSGSDGMIWQANPARTYETFTIEGRQLLYAFNLSDGSILGPTFGIDLLRAMPFGWETIPPGNVSPTTVTEDAIAYGVGIVGATIPGEFVFRRVPFGTTWQPATGTLSIGGQISILLH